MTKKEAGQKMTKNNSKVHTTCFPLLIADIEEEEDSDSDSDSDLESEELRARGYLSLASVFSSMNPSELEYLIKILILMNRLGFENFGSWLHQGREEVRMVKRSDRTYYFFEDVEKLYKQFPPIVTNHSSQETTSPIQSTVTPDIIPSTQSSNEENINRQEPKRKIITIDSSPNKKLKGIITL